MTDKNLVDLTNEDIMSSLKVIATTRNCDECKIRNCKWGTCNCEQITANAALELINRQKAEIKSLIEGLKLYDEANRVITFQIAVREKEIANLQEEIRNLSVHGSKDKAYKEFAERLKQYKMEMKGYDWCKDFTDCSGWVKLPKKGDKVYYIYQDPTTCKYSIHQREIYLIESKDNHFYFYATPSISFKDIEFGKSVFLTPEEAEKALEGKK